jgi:hypothetical protein
LIYAREEVITVAKGSGSSKGSSGSGKGSDYRSAKTGRYVTEKFGKSHPSTTVKETKKK